MGPGAICQARSETTVCVVPSVYSSRIWAMALSDPKVPVNLV